MAQRVVLFSFNADSQASVTSIHHPVASSQRLNGTTFPSERGHVYSHFVTSVCHRVDIEMRVLQWRLRGCTMVWCGADFVVKPITANKSETRRDC